MARPRLITPGKARAEWLRAVSRLGYPPSGKAFAAMLGVSERTIWRWMPSLRSKQIEMCPRCQGRGYVLRPAAKR